MMRMQLRISAALVLFGLLALAGQAADRPASSIKVVELAGDGAAMGRQHGEKLGAAIRELHGKYLARWFENNEQAHQQALLAAMVFRTQLLPRHRAELAALAQASGIDSGDAMLGNCFLDLMPAVACSTVALEGSAAPDGVARLGRNLDFPSFNIADKTSIVMIFRPTGQYAFAAVTWPGLIGVLSGMNEHGLTLCNMEVDRPMRVPQAMPYTLLYRRVLEECRTVDEAIAVLEKTPRQSANNLMLMDAPGNRAVAEITPEKVTVRRAPAGKGLFSTNHQRGNDQATPGRCRRYDTLRSETARAYGKIDVPALRRMLGQVAQGPSTLQSMVFEPAQRKIYLAAGSEATRLEYQEIDLGKYFAKAGGR